MADKKISELTNITGANLANNDEFVVVDVSADETKAVTREEFFKSIPSIDVTGTVTADGLTVDGNIALRNADNITFKDTGGAARGILTFDANNDIVIGPAGAGIQDIKLKNNGAITRLNIDVGGDISFYEDTGTTPKFFWDASAESLGIGTSSPSSALHVKGGLSVATFESTSSFAFVTVANSGGSATISSNNNNLALITPSGSGGEISFSPNSSEKMRITSTGAVGIGTNSPASKFDILGGTTTGEYHIGRFYAFNGSNNKRLDVYVDNTEASPVVTLETSQSGGSTPALALGTGGSERMRIDASGNLLVGKTSADNGDTAGIEIQSDGQIFAAKSGDNVAYFNRISTDGTIVQLEKDGATVGSIGSAFSGSSMYIDGASSRTGIYFATSSWTPRINGANVDNQVDLGGITNRFDDIYATNGTIQTSDRNEKQDIEELSEAEQRVAVACKGLLRKFRWKDAVEEKGDDARIHFGIIAQDLQDAFEAEGLDAGRYAMFISSTWTDEETGEERSRMGVRYPQLLAFIIAAI
jgi:hypothetical protein